MVSTNGRPTTGEIASVTRDYPGLTYAADFLRHNDKTLLTRGNGKRVTELYREVERDPRVYAVLQQRYAAVLGREIVVEAASSKSQDKKAAAIVESQIKQLNNRVIQASDKAAIYTLGGFEYFSACMLDAILIGYSVAEIDWAVEAGIVYPRQIWARDAGRFRFNVADGGYELQLLTWSNAVGETLPPRKFLINSFGSRDGNPYGLGLGSTLFWPWWFKKNAIKFWLTYADKFGSPTLKGTYQNENQKHKLLQIMRDASQQAGVALPEGVMLDLLSAPGGSTSTYETLCNYCDQLLTLCVLNQNLTSNISSGSYAASETHMEVREELTDADTAMLTDGPYRDLATWITFYNVPDAQPPLIYRPRSKVINSDRASRDEILSRIMQRPLDEEYVKLHYDVTFQKVEEQPSDGADTPLATEDEELQEIGFAERKLKPDPRRQATSSANGSAADETQRRDVRAVDPLAPNLYNLDNPVEACTNIELSGDIPVEDCPNCTEFLVPTDILTQIALDSAKPIFQDWLDTLESHLFEGAESLEEIRDRVESVYPQLDAAAFATTMQQVMTLGYGAGRYEVLEEVGEAAQPRSPRHPVVRDEESEFTEGDVFRVLEELQSINDYTSLGTKNSVQFGQSSTGMSPDSSMFVQASTGLSKLYRFGARGNDFNELALDVMKLDFSESDNLILTYAEIGRRFTELVLADSSEFIPRSNFAETGRILIEKPELLAVIRRLLSKYYTDGIDAIANAYADEEDNIKGVFLDHINSQVTKRLAFKITDSDVSYRLLNPGLVESANFSEEDILDFASPKQCKKGIACGNSCISASKTCKKQITPAQTQAKQAVVSRAKASTAAVTNTPPTTKPTTTKKTSKNTLASSATSPVSQTRSPIKTNSTELDKSRADLVDRFGQKTIDAAEQNVQRILNDADTNVYIRVGSSDTLEKILGDRFKTSAELGVDTHQIPHLKDGYQSARNRVEAKILGYDEKNTNPDVRPIYGYLGGKDLNGSSHADVSAAYGSIAVKLRSEAKDRSTFTSADSFKSGIASEIINAGSPPPPNAASLVSTTRHGYDRDNLPSHYPSYYKSSTDDKPQLQATAKAKSIDDLALVGATTGNRYMEAQIHGPVSRDDIAEIHFSPRGVGDRPNAAIAQYAKDNGIDLYVNGKKVDPDDIINPKTKRTKLNDLSDAIDKEDFDTVTKIADDIHANAEKLQLAPGEVDRYLKQLFIDSEYDGLPKVAAKDDVTKIWQDGGTLMVRGMDAGPNGKTQFFDQFKSGDYFTGNGIYGNGTYVSVANGSTPKDAKKGLDILRSLAYSKASGVTMRMALPSDANVIDAKALTAEMKDFKKKFDNWASDEEQKIYAGALGGASFKKTVDKYKKDYNPKGATVTVLQSGQVGGLATELIRVDIPNASGGGISKSIPVQMTRNAKDDYTVSIGGVTKKVKGLDKATKTAVEMVAETRAKSDLMSDPALQQKISNHNRRLNQTREVLFGDEAGGTSGRFATVRGYDAVKLSNSYEPNNFMILLNRSKILVQDTELNYKTALKDVAG